MERNRPEPKHGIGIPKKCAGLPHRVVETNERIVGLDHWTTGRLERDRNSQLPGPNLAAPRGYAGALARLPKASSKRLPFPLKTPKKKN